jgi:penicillin-binding protein 1C
LLVASIVAVASVALWRFVDDLGPLDLSVAEARSTVVADRDGRLLRAFATEDGRWRLPVGPAEVDPRFLALLKAAEDARFDRHRSPWRGPAGSSSRPAGWCPAARR